METQIFMTFRGSHVNKRNLKYNIVRQYLFFGKNLLPQFHAAPQLWEY